MKDMTWLHRLWTLVLSLSVPALVSPDVFAATEWFKFKKSFIESQYSSDSAFGSLTAARWKAGPVHSISCGGKDGEMHVGAFESDLQVSADQKPMSSPVDRAAEGWGVVFEPPNVRGSTVPADLNEVPNDPITFKGYFRLWNEGHSTRHLGEDEPDSNPNHVLELHPAWEMTSNGKTHDYTDLLHTIPGYQGYGASKFRPILETSWLYAYQDDQFLYVQLLHASNFFQLPVEVKNVRVIEGGAEIQVDVYSDRAFQRLRYSGLRCIAVEREDIGGPLDPGDRVFLLGLFSVNLRKALEASVGSTADNPREVKEALEFFIFGRAIGGAVSSCP